RVAVDEAALHVGHPRAAVHRDELHDAVSVALTARHRDDAVARVLHDVRRKLARDDFAVAAIAFSEAQALGLLTRRPPDNGHAGPIGHSNRHAAHFHRLTLTRVPSPGVDSISNSFMSRRD